MPYFLEELLTALYEFLLDVAAHVVGYFSTLLGGLVTWIVDFFTYVYVYAQSRLPASWFTYIETIDWNGILSYYEDVAWILPINEVLLIVAGAYSVCGVIRLIRWVLGLLPTIGG